MTECTLCGAEYESEVHVLWNVLLAKIVGIYL